MRNTSNVDFSSLVFRFRSANACPEGLLDGCCHHTTADIGSVSERRLLYFISVYLICALQTDLWATAHHPTLLCYSLNTLSQFLVSLLREKHIRAAPMASVAGFNREVTLSEGHLLSIRTILFLSILETNYCVSPGKHSEVNINKYHDTCLKMSVISRQP